MGEDSEEGRIIKTWHDNIEEAQLVNRKQSIQNFDNLLTEKVVMQY